MRPTLATPPQLRLRAAPTYDPPFDDQATTDWRSAGASQPMLAAPQPLAPAGTSGPAGASGGSADRRSPTAAAPATTAAAVRFVNTCLEILNGYRAVNHLRAVTHPLAAPEVIAAMTQAVRRLRRTVSPQRASPRRESLVKVRQMRTCEPRPGVAELAVVVGARVGPQARDERSWALAFRLEQTQDRWLCTAAQLL
ncbi:hypothetical protein JQS43_20415 [Natronosporangium hydrolyticum]|uniref:Uncharacterized protein n=1 Tax=Natronosporangium hydrolyticum TaxID=2811111 RepID=A0A895Y992_9ACTN|nr:Rv3235 family protein [Natronosporangium hydrolyticum]QSB13891.1 hypothetical protein JQS43_20415 [Natronosporangium hydrolyticum]